MSDRVPPVSSHVDLGSIDMTSTATITPASSSSSTGSSPTSNHYKSSDIGSSSAGRFSSGQTNSLVSSNTNPSSISSFSPGPLHPSSPSPAVSTSTASGSSQRRQAKQLPMSPLGRMTPVDGESVAPRMSARPMSLPPRPSPAQYVPQPHHASPCYVHGNLNQSASLQGWLDQNMSNVQPAAHSHRKDVKSSPKHPSGPQRSKSQLKLEGYEEKEDGIYEEDSAVDSDDQKESLTRQLAETAVGVREMSRQLGRTRVRSNISNILIVTKARDNRLIKLTRQLALYLMSKPRGGFSASGDQRRGMVVYVDAQLATSKRFDAAGIERDHPEYFRPIGRRRSSSSASVNTVSGFSSDSSVYGSTGEGQLRYWTSDMCSKSPHLFDFVVTLGGDGTVLFTSWLFQKIVPPVLPFALGSLGFLTNFDFANYKNDMDQVFEKGIRVNLRMRFTCTVYRAVAPDEENAKGRNGVKAVRKQGGEILMSEVGKTGWEALEGGTINTSPGATEGLLKKKDKEVMCFTTRPVETFEVLNDLVVDRGPSPFVSLLELFGDEHHMTTVQADGLTVSTPTGSTAYSLSAGGSLVHPEIPALLITPICPHTLSFRPMLLPDSMELRICVPYNSRSTAWASFDGRGRVELKQGDHIKVTASQYPFPTVCADKQSTDWFHAIQRTLRWNEREKQKSFVVIEEARAPKPLQPPSTSPTTSEQSDPSASVPERASEEEEEEEEEKFDIDDSSTTGNNSHVVSPSSSSAHIPRNHHLNPSLQFTHKSGLESPDRFAPGSSQPHPTPISTRHIIDALSKTRLSSASGTHHPHRAGGGKPKGPAQPNDGEQGQWDDIHDPDSLRVSGSRIPSRSERTSTSGAPVKEPEETPRPAHRTVPSHVPHRSSVGQSHQPSKSKDHGPQDHDPSRARTSRDAKEAPHRAFAFFGQDESDTDVGDSD